MDDETRIRAVLEHIRKGSSLGDFPGTRSEKLAVVAKADRFRLVEWSKARGRYRITLAGRWKLVNKRRLAMRLSGPAVAITVAMMLAFGFRLMDRASWLASRRNHGRGTFRPPHRHSQRRRPSRAIPPQIPRSLRLTRATLPSNHQ
jgi:hypothetical protein